MTKYGEGYILKESLIDLVEWDNDIEQWVISDDDLDYLMTKNDIKHGKLEDLLYIDAEGNHYYWCSNCHTILKVLDGNPIKGLEFCPICGIKID